MDFSVEERKRLLKEFKIMAIADKLKAEAIEKEIKDNGSKYTDEELEIFNKLLRESNESYLEKQETYCKGSLLFGLEDLRRSISE